MSPIQSWWDWCAESFGHMFLGVTAPLLLVLAFLVMFMARGNGGDDSSAPQPPRADVAGVCLNATPGSIGAPDCETTGAPTALIVQTATPVPPTPTPAPRSYTVQAGDTLSLICATEAPAMSQDACVDAIVSLSNLGGPDAIAEGQTLRLPPAASTPAPPTSSASTRRTPTATPPPVQEESAATPEVVFEPEPTATQEPEPTPYASLVALGPADIARDDEAEPAAEVAETPEQATPTAEEIETSEGTEYVVEDGDSLLGICVERVPDMPEDECIEFVVLLNALAGPDEITAGQVLILP